MKKRINSLRRGKGFTIVECIVAIAVFAALVLVVFMILTLARNSAKTANESEGNLSKMIQNVVGDDSYRDPDKYESLLLQIDDTAVNAADPNSYFTVSYNLVNGYKNFLQCTSTSCPYYQEHTDTDGNHIPYRANNTEFMVNAAGKHLDPDEFNPASDNYACPLCGTVISGHQLKCDECETIGGYKDTAKFGYIEQSGGYYCKNCGGSNVMAWLGGEYVADAAEQQMASANDSFSISGLYANAIKYGQVENKDAKDLVITYSDVDGPCSSRVKLTLSYNAYNSPYVPGTYTLKITSEDTANKYNTVRINLPPYYIIDEDGTSYKKVGSTNSFGGEMLEMHSDTQNASFTVKFRLKNVKSGYAFEYDYNKSGASLKNPDGSANLQGLFAWFGCGSYTYPRSASGYIIGNTGDSAVIITTTDEPTV